MRLRSEVFVFFFFNDTATTEIYTLSLHDALPISEVASRSASRRITSWMISLVETVQSKSSMPVLSSGTSASTGRSEEHTSELQSRQYLVCRLLLEKKKKSQSCTWAHKQQTQLPHC